MVDSGVKNESSFGDPISSRSMLIPYPGRESAEGWHDDRFSQFSRSFVRARPG
jgi:hypothetical protein